MKFISKRDCKQNTSIILGITVSDRKGLEEFSQNFDGESAWNISTPELHSGPFIPIESTSLKTLGGLYKSLFPVRKYET